MARLNDTAISKLRWDTEKRTRSGGTPQFQAHYDAEVKGLHLRILPPDSNGRSSKIFWLKYGTERKVYRIGEFGEWSVSAARDEAQRIRREFYSYGTDPNQARQKRLKREREEREKEKGRLTVSRLFAAYMDEREVGWADTYRTTNRLHMRRIKHDFGKRFADELTAVDDVEAFFLKWKNHSASMAELMRKFGHHVYQWGMRKKLLPLMENPFDLIRDSGSSELNPFKVGREKRTRCLEYDKGEAEQLFRVCAQYDRNKKDQRPGSISYEAVAKLMLLLGCRGKELRLAMWEHVDHDLKTLRNVSPKGGAKNAYTMPLTDMAYELLEGLGVGPMRNRTGPIFPTQRVGKSTEAKPLTRWAIWYDPISKMPGMPLDPQYEKDTGQPGHITMHDLRRSAITWLQSMRYSEEWRTIFKGSRVSSVTSSVYSQADAVDIRRECAEAIEARIRDVEAGNERTMFDQWRAGKLERQMDRIHLVVS